MESIIIFRFMIVDLKLKGFELLLYALIYSFSQHDQLCYMYPEKICKTLGCSRSQFFRARSSLISKELISLCETSSGIEGMYALSKADDDPGLRKLLDETIRICKTPWVY